MAAILSFTPAMPSQTCPRCEGKGYEASIFNPFVGEVVAVPCGKCDATGQFTALMEAEGEVRYWRSLVESLSHARAPKQLRHAHEQLEFWTNKTAMYAVMRKAR